MLTLDRARPNGKAVALPHSPLSTSHARLRSASVIRRAALRFGARSASYLAVFPSSGSWAFCEGTLNQGIIESILKSELTQVDSSAVFEESIRDCYPETTKVGWLELDTESVMKEMDPISWHIAQSEWESQEADEGNIMRFDNGTTYYWLHEVETFLDASEIEVL